MGCVCVNVCVLFMKGRKKVQLSGVFGSEKISDVHIINIKLSNQVSVLNLCVNYLCQMFYPFMKEQSTLILKL